MNTQHGAAIELPRPVNRSTVEEAWRRARAAHKRQDLDFGKKGMRAARDRNPKLMLALEQASEVLHQLAHEQYGQTEMRMSSTGHRGLEPGEYKLWREAYRLADEGQPLRHLEYIYGAAFWLAGLDQ